MTNKSNNKRKTILIAGCSALALYILIAVFAPVIAPYDASADLFEPYLKPTAGHLLGTNDLGQDIFSELIMGTRLSLLVGLTAAVISITLGILFGVGGGWFGGAIDNVLSAICAFFIALPFFPLVILLSALVNGGPLTSAIILGLLGWQDIARVLRSQTLELSERQYILDIRAMGAKNIYILSRHISRELLPMIVYRFILSFRAGILAEATLSFLGLGSPISKSWGNMLYYAQAKNAFLTGAWKWWVLPPGFAIAFLVFALLLISYSFESASDPRLEGTAYANS